MKPLLALALIALTAGCAGLRKTGTADVEIQSGTNSVRIRQPKDTTIGKLIWNPQTGQIELTDYASTVNAGLVAAGKTQSESVVSGFRFGIEMLKDLGIAGADAYSGRAVTRPPVSSLTIPPGMKAVQRGSEVLLVPKDDPSVPQPEIVTPKL